MLRKKRYAVPLLLMAVLLLALTPHFLSSAPVLRFVAGAIDARLPGSLSIDSWLVSWQQGILWQQVVYTDPEQGIRLRIPQMTTTRGLLELVLAPSNMGLMVLSGPQLELAVDAPTAAVPVSATAQKSSPTVPFWNHLAGELEIREGQVTVTLAEPEMVTGVRDVSLSASLASGVVTFALGVHALHDQGSATVEGTLNLPARGEGGLGTLVADAKFIANGLQLRDLLTIAEKKMLLPAGEGVLSADLQFKGASLEGFQVSGWAELGEVHLRGGFLGTDTPAWQRLRLDIDGGKWATNGWSARQFDFVCDTAEAHGSFDYGAEGMQLTGKGRVNLPVFFAQFPRLLHLRETVQVETGTMDFTVALGRSGDAQHLDLSLRAEPFSGLTAGDRFAWAGPVAILLNGERTGHEVQVDALMVDTPFFKADGRGDLHSFVLDASADLNQASLDLGRLFQLDWSGAGRMDLSVMGTVENEAQERFRAATDLKISGFALNNAGAPIVPPGDFSVLGSVSAPFPLEGKEGESLDMQLAVSSWLGETFLTIKGVKAEGRPLRAYYSTDTSLSLDNASGLLHRLKVLPATATVAGDMQVQATGYLSAAELEIRDFTGEIGNLVLAREGASFAEKQVRLEISQSINEKIKAFTAHNLIVAASREEFFRTGAGSNMVNLAGHSLFFRDLSLTSATGNLTLAELLLPDWRNPFAGLQAELTGTFDLERLSGLLRGAALVNGQTDLGGTGQLTLRAAPVGQGGQEMIGELRLADVGLVREKKRVPLSRELRLDVRMARQSPEGEIDIKELRLLSDPLQVEGSGAVRRGDAWRKVELQGRITPVLEQVSTLLRDGFGIDLRLSGGQGEPFLAQFPLAGPEGNSGAAPSLVTSLHADRLEYQGVAVRSLHLPFSLENRGLHLEVTGQLDDEGKLVLIADTDLAGDSATVTIPANSQILTGALVQKPLVDKLLVFLHPLLGSLAWPAGRFDLRLNSFAWPLGKTKSAAAEFTAVMDLRDLTVESGQVLREILTLFGLEKEPLLLMASEMDCTGRQGRVTCEKLRVRLSEAEMVVSGAVGLDGTLDVLLEVPVTRKLVSEEGFRYLQGTTVRVPVRGTVRAPVFDRDKTTASVRDLLQQAAGRLLEEKKQQRSRGADRAAPERRD